MYVVTRRYKGMAKREDLAEELELELAPQPGDVGLAAFAVVEEGNDLISVSKYAGEELATRGARRRPAHPDLTPEAKVEKKNRDDEPQG